MKIPFLFFILAFSTNNLFGQCNNQRDYSALRALYLSTDGDNWNDNNGWPDQFYFMNNPTPNPVPELFGWYGLDFCQFNRIREVRLFGNNLIGFIPTEIEQLDSLNTLNLSSNKLSGAIPKELGSLNLLNLNLSANLLNGSIPYEIGNISRLGVLYLSYNNLSGPIPKEIGNLTRLGVFEVQSNMLSGAIPPELGNLYDVYRFLVRGNNLTGNIPTSFNQLSELVLFDVSGNKLSGCYHEDLKNPPSVLCNFGNSSVSNFNNFCDSWDDFCMDNTIPCSPYIYVDQSATGNNDGSSWSNAYMLLDEAVNNIDECNPDRYTILVAQGTYSPSGFPSGCTNCIDSRDYSHNLVLGTKIFGGFPPAGSTLGNQNPTLHPTIISGELGTPNITDNIHHAFISTGAYNNDLEIVLDGIIISDFNSNGTGSIMVEGEVFGRFSGSAGYFRGANLTKLKISNCIIEHNNSTSGPSGFYCSFLDSLNMIQTLIRENTTGAQGTMYASNCNSSIANCDFIDNTSTNIGASGAAAMFNFPKSAFFNRCKFENNVCSNMVSFSGAVYGKNVDYYNCIFKGNKANLGGAIAYLDANSSSDIVNCLFYDNEAYDRGGAIFKGTNDVLNIVNSTITENTADNSGDGIYLQSNGPISIYNSIVFNNSDEINLSSFSGILTIDHSLIDVVPPPAGNNNLNGDPLFINPALDSFQIASNSLCRDGGLNSSYNLYGISSFDLAAQFRFYASDIDMGAFEYYSCNPNTWIGPNEGNWYDNTAFWSLDVFPIVCQPVRILNGAKVTLNAGEIGYGLTLEVSNSSELDVKTGGELCIENL